MTECIVFASQSNFVNPVNWVSITWYIHLNLFTTISVRPSTSASSADGFLFRTHLCLFKIESWMKYRHRSRLLRLSLHARIFSTILQFSSQIFIDAHVHVQMYALCTLCPWVIFCVCYARISIDNRGHALRLSLS